MLQKGQRVSVLATVFDARNDHSWSVSMFGDQWQSARCYGVVKKIIKSTKCALVLWDIDNSVAKISLNELKLEDEDSNDVPGCSREPSTAQSIIADHDIVAEDISESDTDDSSSISGSPHEDDFACEPTCLSDLRMDDEVTVMCLHCFIASLLIRHCISP
nr:unnamed protein product [Callosobruchus chinensis]